MDSSTVEMASKDSATIPGKQTVSQDIPGQLQLDESALMSDIDQTHRDGGADETDTKLFDLKEQ